jgi:SnoaL-like domain
MGNTELPAAIRAFIDTTNAGDTEGFVATFTEDAYLSDWGREFHGRDGVRSWNRTDNIGKQAEFSNASAVDSPEPGAYDVTLQVAGNGYNGTGNMKFQLRDNRIQSLVIS